MILTIIAMLMIPVGVWMVRKDKYEGAVYGMGLLFTVGGGFIAFIMAICIICAHVGVDAQIEETRIEYESLCERQEIVESECVPDAAPGIRSRSLMRGCGRI